MSRPLSRATLALLAASFVVACSQPFLSGPQLQRQLRGFFYDANSTQGRNVFPDREMLRQGAWWSNIDDDDEYSSIFITTYSGGATREDVQSARDFQEAEYGRGRGGYGGLELLRIDDRVAWGWLETDQFQGEVSAYEFKAVISYDSVTYVVEFYTREPERMVPDSLRAVVDAFAIGRVKWNLPGLGVAALVTLVLSGFMWDRFQRIEVTAGRVRQMRLAVIPTQDDDEEGNPE